MTLNITFIRPKVITGSGTYKYSYTILNRESEEVSLILDKAIPSPLTGSLGVTVYKIPPNGRINGILTVVIPVEASSNTYEIGIVATHGTEVTKSVMEVKVTPAIVYTAPSLKFDETSIRVKPGTYALSFTIQNYDGITIEVVLEKNTPSPLQTSITNLVHFLMAQQSSRVTMVLTVPQITPEGSYQVEVVARSKNSGLSSSGKIEVVIEAPQN
ncbi:MAG: hypothetical protein WC208_16035 [Gallionella sp.]|jgi:uncharacterized membrane protein